MAWFLVSLAHRSNWTLEVEGLDFENGSHARLCSTLDVTVQIVNALHVFEMILDPLNADKTLAR